MALNCSMLDNQNKPIPLPDEKIFLTVNGITISLVPTLPGSGTTDGEPISPTDSNQTQNQSNSSKSKLPLSSLFSNLTLKNSEKLYPGTVYITNQRILFISNHESEDQSIKTLTIPLSNSLDGRFIQPWLSANYHLSTVLPVNGGNLEELLSSRFTNNSDHPILFTLKVVFNEGHGFEFYEALEEVKRLHSEANGQRTTVLEELPTYSPTTQPNELIPIETTSEIPTLDHVDSSRSQQRRDTMPDEDLILAAQTALEVERIEQDLVLESSTNLNPTHHDDHPPLYEP
ncbi:uncharacterized protein MELLADRAFT_78105 [Melampsora larici-populina 98AG31]|uniref:GRAM domain-containing protein n=1 Tax=Melampsora larici-populina (strain 98AG31 / pathotype 3-4-7) TaxID=747676 RepID=F4RQ77_MELLP|nr:uncharacterized protein MELLADRAFT_78105 [Melampsora larici-populina 98AG31]EGG05451.1 hypothetical protein MELLADRAFT_78105 [Melampsora larici-populina 98AG31]